MVDGGNESASEIRRGFVERALVRTEEEDGRGGVLLRRKWVSGEFRWR